MASESKSSGGIVHQQKEKYEDALNAAIPEADSIAAAGRLAEAVDTLMAVEKRARLSSDSTSTERAVRHIIKLAAQYGTLSNVVECIMVLSKRRAQLTKAIIGIVQEGVTVLEGVVDTEERVTLIDALRTVSEGKIFVEVERARLTQHLANIREAQGRVTEACDVLQEVQVETIADMDSREKAEFLLQQMRLTLAVEDWVRSGIMAGKVSRPILAKEGFEDLKLQFYDLLITLHSHEQDTWELHRDYLARYETPGIHEEALHRQQAMSYAVLYLAMTEWSDSVRDTMKEFLQKKHVTEELPPCAALLQALVTPEIIQWPLAGGASNIPQHSLFTSNPANLDTLHRRVVQHNLRVISACYTRIRFPRMCALLGLEPATAEKELSDLVTSGTVYARIDRPAGVVSFVKPQAAPEVLGEFAGNLREVLGLIETTNHLIQREYMVHKMH